MVEKEKSPIFTDNFATPYPGEITLTRDVVSLKEQLKAVSYEILEYQKGKQDLIYVRRKAALGRESETYWDSNGIVVMTKLYEEGELLRTTTYECDEQRRLVQSETCNSEGRVTDRIRYFYGKNPIDKYEISIWRIDPETSKPISNRIITSEDRESPGFNIFDIKNSHPAG